MNSTQPVLEPEEPVTPLFNNRPYMTLWAGQAISTLGSGMSGLAYPLLALKLTHSPALAGLVATVFGLPYLLISLPAGAYVDRWDRKRVMIICDTIRALNAGAIPLAAFTGHLTMIQLMVAATIEGTCFVFFNIAETAALPRVVPKSQIPAASSQNQAAQAGAALISPPLAGLIFKTLGRTIPFFFDAISYAASVVSLMLIRIPFQLERVAPQQHIRAEIAEGVRWLINQRLVRFTVALTGSMNFVGSALFLSFIIIAQHLGANAFQIGIMLGISAFGGLAGALVAWRIQQRFTFAQVIIACVWISALAVPLVVIAPDVFVIGMLGGIMFFVGPIYNAVQFSYRMAIIPDALQGRVNSAARMIIFGTQPLGAALGGVSLQVIGPKPTILILAAISIFMAIITSLNRELVHAKPYSELVPEH